MDGIIFNIQRFSLHDGPGLRTTVFLSGCNLRCRWCHNPESFVPKPIVRFFPIKCIGCGDCLSVCEHAGHISVDGVHIIDRENCVGCGKCAETCCANALEMSNYRTTTGEVLKTVLLDKPFYKDDGGMTVSGGEPLLQYEFARELFKGAKEAGITTALDTAGAVPFERFEAVLPYVDTFLFDVKCMDPVKPRAATGVDNALIFENLKKLSAAGGNILIRTPVIPNVNDNEENMAQMAAMLAPLKGVQGVELLPYHPLGGGKYESLGLTYPMPDVQPPSKEHMQRLAEVIRLGGVRCKVS
ncbi:MAG: glycyl-radical enzyme activating protein [Oscillospiraceae bacterium]|nr:glycyl-radical enzyme activating protein [Oscillospiraceae bacterium]